MNNQLKNDHYVYVMQDKFGIIRYIGEGRNNRLNDLSGRTSEFLAIYHDDAIMYKIRENLTKNEAIKFESEYLESYLNNPTESVNLVNKMKGRVVREIRYEDIADLFNLDEQTGELLRTSEGTCQKRFVGKVAGYTNPRGYVMVAIKGISYRAHRLVWVLYNKQNLSGDVVINHIDGNPTNNRPSNLEMTSALVNCHKKVNYKLTKTGILGVTLKNHPNAPDGLVCASYATLNNCNKYKCFSVRKYGYDQAIQLATSWRLSKLKETYPDIYKD